MEAKDDLLQVELTCTQDGQQGASAAMEKTFREGSRPPTSDRSWGLSKHPEVCIHKALVLVWMQASLLIMLVCRASMLASMLASLLCGLVIPS